MILVDSAKLSNSVLNKPVVVVMSLPASGDCVTCLLHNRNFVVDFK